MLCKQVCEPNCLSACGRPTCNHVCADLSQPVVGQHAITCNNVWAELSYLVVGQHAKLYEPNMSQLMSSNMQKSLKAITLYICSRPFHWVLVLSSHSILGMILKNFLSFFRAKKVSQGFRPQPKNKIILSQSLDFFFLGVRVCSLGVSGAAPLNVFLFRFSPSGCCGNVVCFPSPPKNQGGLIFRAGSPTP